MGRVVYLEGARRDVPLAPVPAEGESADLAERLERMRRSYTLNLKWRDVELRTVIQREEGLALRALMALRLSYEAGNEHWRDNARIIRHHRGNARALTRMLRPVAL